MSEDRATYGTKPAQFRLPAWAHAFLAEESAAAAVTKTDVVVRALEAYRRTRFEEHMAEGYRQMAAEDRADARVWEPVIADGLDPLEW